MAGSIITAGDASIGTIINGPPGSDGTLILQSGPSGAKVNAATFDTLGNMKSAALAAPAFSAYQSTAQSLPATTFTKLQFQTKEFDTANTFDAVTNFRFQPLVAGYYLINGQFQIATTVTLLVLAAYKNGSIYRYLAYSNTGASANGASLMFLNGSTDYIELYASQAAAAQNTVITYTSFQAYLARSV